MTSRWLNPFSVAVGGLLAVAACTPGEAVAPVQTPVVIRAATEAPQCAAGAAETTEPADWPLGGRPEAHFLPVVVSSLVSVGPNRFLYNVLDPAYRQLAAPNVKSSVRFYALERDAVSPVISADAAYLGSGLGRGLYRATVDFDCVGEWGAEIAVELEDGSTLRERLRFRVHPQGDTPGIGDPAPRSVSLTAFTEQAAELISTDRHPYPAAYAKTVAETVSSGRPSLVFFATPAFCQTGFCGPTVDLVKAVAMEHEGEVEFVNVEPYQLQMTENGLQPLLDDEGHLQPVQAAIDYGIPIEPYLFLVDADGNVFSRFEGIVGGDELRAAIEDVLAANVAVG